jgi:hypothetical protein
MSGSTSPTLTQFVPSATAPFQFLPTFDGNVYTVIVKWNLARQGFYLAIYDVNATLLIYKPMIGSPPNYDINLIYGLFMTSTLVYRVSTNNFEVSP